jgi:hypothetical protein
VVRACLEDRRQPDRVDAELLQVVELLHDAFEVAAEEVAVEDAGRARVLDLLVPGRMEERGHVAVEDLAARVVAPVAVAEAVDEDLVDDRALQPRGRREGAVVDGELEGVAAQPRCPSGAALAHVSAAVVVAVPQGPARGVDAERVGDDLRPRRRAVGHAPDRSPPSQL